MKHHNPFYKRGDWETVLSAVGCSRVQLGVAPSSGLSSIHLFPYMWPRAPLSQLRTLPEPCWSRSLDLGWQTLITSFTFPQYLVLNLQRSWKSRTMNTHIPFMLIYQLLTFCHIWFISWFICILFLCPIYFLNQWRVICTIIVLMLNKILQLKNKDILLHTTVHYHTQKIFPQSSHMSQQPF